MSHGLPEVFPGPLEFSERPWLGRSSGPTDGGRSTRMPRRELPLRASEPADIRQGGADAADGVEVVEEQAGGVPLAAQQRFADAGGHGDG